MNYEALVAAPDSLASELVSPLRHDGSRPNGGWHHAVAANPSLYEEPPRPIVADRRWESGLSHRDVAVTTVLTAPLLGPLRLPDQAQTFTGGRRSGNEPARW